MTAQFHETPIGQTFLKGTVPALVRELQQLNGNLEKMSNPMMKVSGDGTIVPMMDDFRRQLNDRRKHACVLAGLRLFQKSITGTKHDVMSIATCGNELTHLSPEEIDALCEELNQ